MNENNEEEKEKVSWKYKLIDVVFDGLYYIAAPIFKGIFFLLYKLPMAILDGAKWICHLPIRFLQWGLGKIFPDWR